MRVLSADIGRELPLWAYHNGYYALKPQYSGLSCRAAALTLAPRAWARTTKKDDGLDLGSRGGPRELERQGEGLIATPPPRPWANADGGHFCLSPLNSRVGPIFGSTYLWLNFAA